MAKSIYYTTMMETKDKGQISHLIFVRVAFGYWVKYSSLQPLILCDFMMLFGKKKRKKWQKFYYNPQAQIKISQRSAFIFCKLACAALKTALNLEKKEGQIKGPI